jgi:O-antigen ligase
MQVWLKNSAYLSLLLLVLVLVDNPARLRALALVMIVTGLAEGLYGTVVYLAGPEFGLWKPYESGHSVAIGTYVNRNHYSALLSMAICLGLGMVTATFRPRQEHGGWRATVRHWLSFLLEPRALMYVVLMLLFGAFFLGQSRGATLGLLVSLTLVIGLGYWWRGNRGPEARLAPLILMIAVGGAAWLGVGDLAARFFTLFSESSERITTWGWTLEMIWDRPWFGVGGGGYEWAFPAYKGQQLAEAYFDHAHNDYLELLADQGLLGAVLLAPAIAMLLWCIGKGYQRRRDPFLRGILFASLAGTLAFLLHGMVDFNFQIPANAAWFHVMLGMGLVAANLRSELDTS